jgi:hypothetical protein
VSAAAQAWQRGGTLGLGAWLAKTKPRFTVKDYAEAVRMAREELGDWTDYSQEQYNDEQAKKG